MIRLISVAFVVLSPLVCMAGDHKPGDMVFLKPDAEATKDGAKVDIKTSSPSPFVVEVEGEMVSLGAAWVHKRDVMAADEAVEFYTEAIMRDQKNSQAYFNRGSVLTSRATTWLSITSSSSSIKKYVSDLEHAKSDLSEAIRLDPTNAEAYGARGHLMMQSDKPDLAIEDSNESIRLGQLNAPSFLPMAYLLRAFVWESKGDFDNAIKDSAAAIKADPKCAAAYSNFARLKSTWPDDNVRDGEQAVEFAIKACELLESGNAVDSWFYLDTLAAAYAKAGDFKNAVESQEKAIVKLDKKDFPGGMMRAMLMMQSTFHLKLYRENSTRFFPQINQADALEMAAEGMKTKAVLVGGDFKQYDEAIRLNPTNSMAYFNRGEAWAMQAGFGPGDDRNFPWDDPAVMAAAAENALSDLGEAIRLDPTNVAAYGTRGRVFVIKAQYDAAFGDLDEAIRLAPQYPGAYATRGDCWKAKGEFDKALKDWKVEIRLDPENAKVNFRKIAWLRATCPDDRFRNGKEAVEFATKASRSNSLMESFFDLFQPTWGDFELYGTLAAANAEVGDFTNAIKWQEKAIESAGEFGDEKTGGSYVPPGYKDRLQLYRANKPYRDIHKK